ncbi:thiamine ABC transporter permease [Vibrio sp.]|nr:thiamine ABC transporter permease [Vibrio sp.]
MRLKLGYFFVLLLCILPTLPGLAGVAISSFGFIPAINSYEFSLLGFHQVFSWHGIGTSITLTLLSALISCYLACLISFSILQSAWGTSAWKKIEALLSPLLSMPHVAFAIGFAFLFSPTGLVARGAEQIADYASTHSSTIDAALLIKDPYALGLTLMLAIKEVPFLLLMSIPVLQQLNIEQIEKVSSSLGYSKAQTWWKCVFPQWLSKIRFPLLAVIAFAVSVVDVPLILGPTNPPTLAVLVWQWFSDPDLTLLPRAAAGAMVLFGLAVILINSVKIIEWLIVKRINHWQFSGRKGIALPGKTAFNAIAIIAALMLPILILWSFTHRWRFPDLLPSRYTSRFWEREWSSVFDVITTSLNLALMSATIALVLALIAHEYRIKHKLHLPGFVIAIPMLVPQLSLLFGMQITSLYVDSSAYWVWVIWAHVFFTFPYVYLALDGPWRSFNDGYTRASLSLGKSPLYTWWMVKLPTLLPAVLFAFAIGMSVSLSQYLPTLALGAGRITTITTEAVALTSGHDRRLTAIYALFQAALPLIFFALAVILSRLQVQIRHFSFKGLFRNDSLTAKSHYH